MAEISQTIQFNASPKEVYELLIDDDTFSQLTDAKAKIDSKVGGNFSVWDKYATGKFIELKPGKKIVQTWRASDWPRGEESTVTYEFSANSIGCQLTFTQTGVPEQFAKDIEQGWQDYYWTLMQEYLKE